MTSVSGSLRTCSGLPWAPYCVSDGPSSAACGSCGSFGPCRFVCRLCSRLVSCRFVCRLCSRLVSCRFVCRLCSRLVSCQFVCRLCSRLVSCHIPSLAHMFAPHARKVRAAVLPCRAPLRLGHRPATAWCSAAGNDAHELFTRIRDQTRTRARTVNFIIVVTGALEVATFDGVFQSPCELHVASYTDLFTLAIAQVHSVRATVCKPRRYMVLPVPI